MTYDGYNVHAEHINVEVISYSNDFGTDTSKNSVKWETSAKFSEQTWRVVYTNNSVFACNIN